VSEQPEYCNACENFPCPGNHPRDLAAEALERYQGVAEAIGGNLLRVLDGLQSATFGGGHKQIYFSPFRNSLVIREGYEAGKRAAAERDRREWLEGIVRRLGLVSEAHRCIVHKGNPEWIWSCRRKGCYQGGYFCPSQADAFSRALAHARSFIPQPERWTELDILAYEARLAGSA
jgi:hypothetical protein